MRRALQVAFGGSLLALVGGGAGLVHVEGQRRQAQSELAELRAELAESEDAAQRAARLRLQVSALTRQVGHQTAELSAGRARAVELDRSLQALREAVAAERAAASQASAEARDALAEARSALATARDEAAAQAAQLERARDAALVAVARLEGELEQSQAAAQALEVELDSQREREQALVSTLREREQALSARAAELRQALAQLDEVDGQLAAAQTRARSAEQTLQVLRDAGVNVGRLTGADPMPDIRARVVKVDLQALPPVLLVDVGSQHGIAVGDELAILRDGREVARLEVAEVRDRLSSARLVQAERDLRLRPGDVVRSRAVRRK